MDEPNSLVPVDPPGVGVRAAERALDCAVASPILFVIVALIGMSAVAVTVPVAIFPMTNFPKIVVGVDNGVTPIDQMRVTITAQSKKR